MSSIEQQLTALENESKALKIAFERAASQFPVFTKTTTVTTRQNRENFDYGGGITDSDNVAERVRVTYTTSGGQNTIATIEIATNSATYPKIRRTNYSGGAQWLLFCDPKNGAGYDGTPWEATILNITVQSLVDGILTAEAI